MTVPMTRAARVLIPNDLRLVWRGGFLLVLLVVGMPLAALGMRWLLPWLTELVAQWVDLEPYYGLILAATLIGTQPANLACAVGILFIDERDEGTLLALQASPLSLRTFMGYRLGAAMVASAVLSVISVELAGLVSVPLVVSAAAAALASLSVPIVALAIAVFVKNKIQAVNALKPLQTWGGIPVFLYFAPTPWQWIGSLVGPLYYPMRLFWSAAEGDAQWWVVVPGLVVQAAIIVWLFRRFERTVFD